MGHYSVNSKRRLVVASVMFLLLIIVSLALASTTPNAKGAGASLVVTPSSGKQGSLASIVGTGFSPGTQMVILCGSTTLGSFTASPEGRVDTTFTVRVPAGTYNIVARDGSSVFATTTYTVIEEATPPPTSSGSQTPKPTSPAYSNPPVYPISTSTWLFPYATITPKTAETGIPTLIIAVVAIAAIAGVISVTFFIRRRGGSEPTYEEESEFPTPPSPVYSPRNQTASTAARYGQSSTYGRYPSRSTIGSRPSTPSRYGQQPASLTRTCPRCRQTVRADNSICPYCHTRLR